MLKRSSFYVCAVFDVATRVAVCYALDAAAVFNFQPANTFRESSYYRGRSLYDCGQPKSDDFYAT